MWGDWRDRYIYGALVIWPPDDVRAVVNPLRERYDPVSASICEAHITLTQPFIRESSSHDVVLVSDVVRRFAPFDVVYGPLDTFLPYPCLYVSIEPAGVLTELHTALQATGLFYPVPDHDEPFVPHMTLLEFTLNPAEITDLLDGMRETAPAGSFVCREIAKILPDSSFRFLVARQFPLGSGRDSNSA